MYDKDARHIIEALRSGIPPDEKQAVQQWEHYGDFFYMLRFVSRYTEQLPCDRILSSPYFYSITHREDGTKQEFEKKTPFLFCVLPMKDWLPDLSLFCALFLSRTPSLF